MKVLLAESDFVHYYFTSTTDDTIIDE